MRIEKYEDMQHGALAWILIYKDKKEIEEAETLFKREVGVYDKQGTFLEPMKIFNTDNSHYMTTELFKALGVASYFLAIPNNDKSEEILEGLKEAIECFKTNNHINIREVARRELTEEGLAPLNEVDAEFESAVDWRLQKKLEKFKEIDNKHIMEDIEV